MDYSPEYLIYNNYIFIIFVGVIFTGAGIYLAVNKLDLDLVLDYKEKEKLIYNRKMQAFFTTTAGIIVLIVGLFSIRKPQESIALFNKFYRINPDSLKEAKIVSSGESRVYSDSLTLKRINDALRQIKPSYISHRNETPYQVFKLELKVDRGVKPYKICWYEHNGILVSSKYKDENIGSMSADKLGGVLSQLMRSKDNSSEKTQTKIGE